jgi:hypothetical protein
VNSENRKRAIDQQNLSNGNVLSLLSSQQHSSAYMWKNHSPVHMQSQSQSLAHEHCRHVSNSNMKLYLQKLISLHSEVIHNGASPNDHLNIAVKLKESTDG